MEDSGGSIGHPYEMRGDYETDGGPQRALWMHLGPVHDYASMTNPLKRTIS